MLTSASGGSASTLKRPGPGMRSSAKERSASRLDCIVTVRTELRYPARTTCTVWAPSLTSPFQGLRPTSVPSTRTVAPSVAEATVKRAAPEARSKPSGNDRAFSAAMAQSVARSRWSRGHARGCGGAAPRGERDRHVDAPAWLDVELLLGDPPVRRDHLDDVETRTERYGDRRRPGVVVVDFQRRSRLVGAEGGLH